MYTSLFGKDYSFPKDTIKFSTPKASAKIVENESGYDITVINNEDTVESNLALKDAELFQKSILFMKLYIKTKSGATFSAGSMSGTVKNEDWVSVVDLSLFYDAKKIAPWC